MSAETILRHFMAEQNIEFKKPTMNRDMHQAKMVEAAIVRLRKAIMKLQPEMRYFSPTNESEYVFGKTLIAFAKSIIDEWMKIPKDCLLWGTGDIKVFNEFRGYDFNGTLTYLSSPKISVSSRQQKRAEALRALEVCRQDMATSRYNKVFINESIEQYEKEFNELNGVVL